MVKTRIKVVERVGDTIYYAQAYRGFWPLGQWRCIMSDGELTSYKTGVMALEWAKDRIDKFLALKSDGEKVKEMLKVRKVSYLKYP